MNDSYGWLEKSVEQSVVRGGGGGGLGGGGGGGDGIEGADGLLDYLVYCDWNECKV